MANIVTWSGDVKGRYPHLNKINSAIIPDSAYMLPAHNRINGYLGAYFAVPFSSDNLTAVDLITDMAYLISGNLKFEEATAFSKSLNERMDRIIAGKEAMILADGTLLSIGGTVFSTTEGYHPTFGMGNDVDFEVDSARMYDEEQERRT